MLSHRNLMTMGLTYFVDVDHIGPQDAIVYAAPMSHGAGLYAIPHLMAGAPRSTARARRPWSPPRCRARSSATTSTHAGANAWARSTAATIRDGWLWTGGLGRRAVLDRLANRAAVKRPAKAELCPRGLSPVSVDEPGDKPWA
jgi:hypothetical protein